jgi:hypothetical protein
LSKKNKPNASSADLEADPEAAKECATKLEFKRAEVIHSLYLELSRISPLIALIIYLITVFRKG